MRLLVDEDEGAGDEEEDGQADGVGDPDEGCCYERHGRVETAMGAGVCLPVGLVVFSRRHTRASWEKESAVREMDETGSWLQTRLELCCAVTFGALWLVKLDGKLSAGVEAEAFRQVGHTASTSNAPGTSSSFLRLALGNIYKAIFITTRHRRLRLSITCKTIHLHNFSRAMD